MSNYIGKLPGARPITMIVNIGAEGKFVKKVCGKCSSRCQVVQKRNESDRRIDLLKTP